MFYSYDSVNTCLFEELKDDHGSTDYKYDAFGYLLEESSIGRRTLFRVLFFRKSYQNENISNSAAIADFQINCAIHLLNLLVSASALDPAKMSSYEKKLDEYLINDVSCDSYMTKILKSCGQKMNFNTFVSCTKNSYDEGGKLIKIISYTTEPVVFAKPSPEKYKAYATSFNFFARRNKIDEGSGLIFPNALLNLICNYLVCYSELIYATTPSYCNLRPGFLLAWNEHSKSKDSSQTNTVALRK